MFTRLARRAFIPPIPSRATPSGLAIQSRFKRYEAFDAGFDQDALKEARTWHAAFDPSQLPKGSTTYARSSGPGGQHVNKTESKAVTVYAVKELSSMLPKLLRPRLRESKYYTAGNDSLTFHAQTHRSRNDNADDNRAKMMDEITRIYRENVPAETSTEKKKKHQDVEQQFHQSRLVQKKFQSAKKQSRKGPSE